MTGMLRGVLREHADSTPAPHLDLDAVIGAGERRVRRARLTTAAVVAAVASVVAGSALVLPGLPSGPGRDDLAAGDPKPFAERRVSYARGDVIHWGSRSFTVSGTVLSFVQTDDGFVYTTKDDDVWLFDGAESQRIGRSGNNSLRADDSGSLVAWVDRAEDGHPQYVLYDTADLREVARVDDGAARVGVNGDDGGAFVYALDDGSAYWRGEEGIVRYDVAAGTAETLSPTQGADDMENEQELPRLVVDAADGLIAYPVSDLGGNRVMVGPSFGDAATEIGEGWNADLSPDGSYVAVEYADKLAVYDTATGAEVLPRLDGYPYRFVFGWVDSDTAMVLGIEDVTARPWSADLLECDVPSGECRVVTAVTGIENGEEVVVPVGDPMT